MPDGGIGIGEDLDCSTGPAALTRNVMLSDFKMALETLWLDPTLVMSACTLPRDCSGGVSLLLHSEASPRFRGFRTVGTAGVSSGSDLDDDRTRAGCGEEGGVEVGDSTVR